MWGHDNLSSFTIKYLRLINRLQEIKRRSVPFFPRCLDYIDLSCYTISEEESHLGTTWHPRHDHHLWWKLPTDEVWTVSERTYKTHRFPTLRAFQKVGARQGVLGGQGAVPHSPPPLGVTVSMKEVRGGNEFIDEFCMSWWASTCLTGGCSLVYLKKVQTSGPQPLDHGPVLASVQARRGVCRVCRYPSCPWSPWPSAPHLVYILHCGFCK